MTSPDSPVRLGAILPSGLTQWGPHDTARRLIDLAAQAEDLGLDSLWANDSLLGPRIEPLTLLAAVAPATRRVTLGTAALIPAFRRPVQAAQAIAGLDQLAEGRLVLAVGAGFPGRSEAEYAASEVPWPRRMARLDDTVALWRQRWTPDSPTAFTGSELRFADLPVPTPTYRPGGPPIWLGGAGPTALDRTGRRYDGWLPYPPAPATYAAGLDAVRSAAARAHRAPAAITPALFATVLVETDPVAGHAAVDAYCRAGYGLPVETVEKIQTIIVGAREEVTHRLQEFITAGARHLVIRLPALDLDTYSRQLAQLAALDLR